MNNNCWPNVRPHVKRHRKLTEGSLFFRFVVSMIRWFIRLKCNRFSEGEENIPAKGAAIVISPHLGSIDATLAPEFVTRCGRMPRILAKASLWKIPIVKQAFNSGKLIPVHREKGKGEQSLKGALEALQNGDLVFIFPEGTYSKDPDKWPMRCKTGAARLALMSGAPIFPILQDGEQFMLKKHVDRTDLPWFDIYHTTFGIRAKLARMFGKKRVLVHLKCYPPLDISTLLPNLPRLPITDPTPEQIMQMNTVIEETLTSITEESRSAKAPNRWDPRLNDGKGGRISND